MNRTYLSPLRYPGSKRKMAPHLLQKLREYNYLDGIFVEPCCGGASASLYLLEQKVVSKVILIDKDPWIASFWRTLFFDTKSLLKDIEDIDVTVEKWEEMRARKPQSEREEALYCFFFNRTCYSGILKGGMIGGHGQKSKYTIDCRFNKQELMGRIRQIAEEFADKVLEVRQDSVFKVLEDALSDKNEDYIYYIDPPYVKKGQRLYPYNFKKDDHKRLKSYLEQLRKPWILSYHDNELVRELYTQDGSLESISLEMQWVADRAKKGTELIISNFPLLKAQRTFWTEPTEDTSCPQLLLS